MVHRANPLPDLERFDPDEVAAGIAAIEAAWQAERQAPTTVPRPAPSRHRPFRYAIAFVAAAVIALVLIGGPILLRDRQEAPVIQEPTTTMPTTVTTAPVVTTTAAATTTTANATTVTLPPMPGVTFTGGSEAEIPEAMIETMIQGGPGLIAAGTLMACGVVDSELVCNGDAGVWISADGGPWERTGDPTLFEGPDDEPMDGSTQWIFDVVDGALGIVAVGDDAFDGAVWRSSDGYTWARVSTLDELGGNDVQSLNAISYGGPGLVAVGRDGMNAGVWVSEDGVTWIRVADPDLVGDSEPLVMSVLAISPDGFVALGRAGFESGMAGGGTGTRPAMWVSTDGLEWQRLPDGTLEALGVREVHSLGGGDDGILLVGSPTEEDGEGLWMSSDGRTWDRIDVPYMGSADESGSVDHIDTQWDGSRWVSVGFEQSTGLVWASFELGVPWQPVGLLDAEAFSDGFEISGLIVTETGFVIISTNEGERREEIARFNTWTGTWDE